jgi:large subunit ribosomal protein L10
VLKKEKERIVAELAERLRSSDTLIVADYRGLSVTQIDDVRTKLLEHGARFSVVKNRLTKRAAEEAGVTGLAELLDGPSAIAFVGEGDMVAVAKALSETARRTRVLEIRGGILQGSPMDAGQVEELAALPPADMLRGQVLAAIVAPLNAIAGLVNAPLENLVGLLDARMEQLEQQGGGETAVERDEEATDQSVAEAPAETTEDQEPAAKAEAPATDEAKEE